MFLFAFFAIMENTGFQQEGLQRRKEVIIKTMKEEKGSLFLNDGSQCLYRIIKSARTTMALQVSREGELVVRIPKEIPFKAGHELALKNKDWILRHVKKSREVLKQRESFHWEDGARVLLFGKELSLKVKPEEKRNSFLIRQTDGILELLGPVKKEMDSEEAIKELVVKWYSRVAGRYLKEKTRAWAAKLGVTYGRISIRDQKTRWGSCSTKGNINYNWRLVLLPEELADYVVVHELCHRVHMNHSKAFWQAVEKELPDYQLTRRKLKGYEDEINQKY